MNGQHIHMGNYEEFFLLYVDDELTPAQKLSVEQFIAAHPDLRVELDMLLDTKLPSEDLEFEGKGSLLRHADVYPNVNDGNIGEMQLLMLDNELDPELAAELRSFMLQDPAAAEAYEILKKTKLPEEEIKFPYKDTLYRTEKKPAAVFTMQWFRVAVAAAVIIVAGLLWTNRQNETGIPSEEKIAKVDPRELTGEEAGRKEQDAPVPNDSNIAETPGPSSNASLQPMKREAVTAKEKAVTNTRDDRNTYAAVEKEEKEEERIAVNTAVPQMPEIIAPRAEEAGAKESIAMQVKTNYATEALGSDNSGDEEYSEEEPRQRKGLRGIVRKVNRFYNKATNPDPDKATVKVASFEIGLQR